MQSISKVGALQFWEKPGKFWIINPYTLGIVHLYYRISVKVLENAYKSMLHLLCILQERAIRIVNNV